MAGELLGATWEPQNILRRIRYLSFCSAAVNDGLQWKSHLRPCELGENVLAPAVVDR